MRKLVLVAAAIIAATVMVTPVGSAKVGVGHCAESPAPVLCKINAHRDAVWQMQDAMGLGRTPSVFADRRTSSEAFRLWILDLWMERSAKWEQKLAEWQEQQAQAQAEAQAQAQAQAQASSSVGGVWEALAQCESGGNWSINTGNGYSGGLQFADSTWVAYGGQQYAPMAYMATPAQQIAIAEAVLNDVGWGAWPACSSRLGLG